MEPLCILLSLTAACSETNLKASKIFWGVLEDISFVVVCCFVACYTAALFWVWLVKSRFILFCVIAFFNMYSLFKVSIALSRMYSVVPSFVLFVFLVFTLHMILHAKGFTVLILYCVAPLKTTMQVTPNKNTRSKAKCVKQVTGLHNNHYQLNWKKKMLMIYKADASTVFSHQ